MTTRQTAKNIINLMTLQIRSGRNSAIKAPATSIKELIQKFKELNEGEHPLPVKENSTFVFFDVYNRSLWHIARLYMIAYALRCGKTYSQIEVPRLENRLTSDDWGFISKVFSTFDFGNPELVIPTAEELNNSWKETHLERFTQWRMTHPNYQFPLGIGVASLADELLSVEK